MLELRLLAAMAISAVVSGTTCAVVAKYGKRLGIIDDPRKHLHPKVIHEKAVPRGGGIPIVVALVVGCGLFLPIGGATWGVVTGALILALTGFVDDKYEEKVSPYIRLVINGVAALAVISAGVGITYINNPLGGILNLDWPRYCLALAGTSYCLGVVATLAAFLWLVWMQNVVGWSSGVDGQLPGFVVIAALTMTVLGLRFGSDSGQWPVVILGGIVAGAFLGFLPWNWYPQKIMPGYGGKSLAGFLLGVLAIMSVAKVGAMMMVLAIPFVDAALVIVKRLWEGRSPVWGGREHLHHYLLEMGWSKRQIAAFYWGVSGVLAIAALRLQATSKYFTMAAVIAVIGGLLLWLHYFSTYLKRPGRDNG